MFLALDFEGSHVDPQRGCPTQLGIALMDDEGTVHDSDEWLCAPPRHYKTNRVTREVDAYALQVAGLRIEDLDAGLDPWQSCHRLSEFVAANRAGSLRVVCFNVAYDIAMYRNMLFFASDWHPTEKGVRVAHPEILGPNWTCAYGMARAVVPFLESHKLDDVAAHFGLSRSGESHGALEDAILAGRVFCGMRKPVAVAA